MVLRQTAANLGDILNGEDVFVDGRVVSNLEMMHDDLSNMSTNLTTEAGRINTTINSLGNDNKTANKRADLARERDKYNSFATDNTTSINARTAEYLALRNNAQNFNLNARITEANRTIPL